MNLRNGTKLDNDCLGAIMTSEYNKKHVVYQLKGVECKTKVKPTNWNCLVTVFWGRVNTMNLSVCASFIMTVLWPSKCLKLEFFNIFISSSYIMAP